MAGGGTALRLAACQPAAQRTLHSWQPDRGRQLRPNRVGLQTGARWRPLTVCSASDPVAKAQSVQQKATELMAKLLKADNIEAVVKENLSSLDQEFFMIASTYLTMAMSEGNKEVATKMRSTLQAALAEKQKTLRPEIRLLNLLLQDTNAAERLKTLNETDPKLIVSDSYFYQLVNQMLLDVQQQPPNDQRDKLLVQLKCIGREAREAAGAGPVPANAGAHAKSKGFGSR